MAVRLGAKPSRGTHRRRAHPMAEINVTPMVDVMLVLLVIFMITAPLLTVGVPVDLPKTKAEAMQDPDEPMVVSVTKDGKIFLQEAELTLEQLGPRVAAISNNNPDVKIFIRGDQAANYGVVAEVLGQLVSAGYRHLALISDSAGGGEIGGGGTAPEGAAPAPGTTGGAAEQPAQ
jgi:biopolymer transport protein TolR